MTEEQELRKKRKAEYIRTICDATGWTEEVADQHLREAKKVGMSYKRYVVNKGWRLSIEEIESMNKRIDERLRKRAENIDALCAASGLSREEAGQKVNEAAKLGLDLDRYIRHKCWNMTEGETKSLLSRLESIDKALAASGWDEDKLLAEMEKAAAMGISNGEYISRCGWDYTDEELLELKGLLELNKRRVAEAQDWHIRVVCEKTGWSYEHAQRLMKLAAKKGYSYKAFIRRALWLKTEEEIEALPPFKLRMSEVKKQSILRKAEQARQYRAAIMEEMGWTIGRTRLEAFRSEILCGSSEAEFYLFQIYKHGIEKGKEFITAEYNSRMNTRYAGWDGAYRAFENKGQFNQDFRDYIRRRWFLSKGMSFEEFERQIEGLDKVICKPLNGIEGIGIEVFKLDGENHREIYDRIQAKGSTIVEQFISQHKDLSAFYPNSVNTMRVMSFLDHGQGKILNSVVKFGTKAEVDNYYQGSIAAGIDVETGVIKTDGVDYAGNIYKTHPCSGIQFCGFQIPHWDKMKELIRTAAMIHSESPYIGWDIAMTEDGPEIIEGNHNQGAYLCQYPFALCAMEGRRYTIDPYLWFDKKEAELGGGENA